jgi:hypothetical protein
MEIVRFDEVEVLGASGSDLACRIGRAEVAIPRILVEPSSDVHEPGDRGTLIIQRWLAIGLGLVSPFMPPAPGPGCGPASPESSGKEER